MKRIEYNQEMFIVQLHMPHEALSLFPPDIDYNMFTDIYKDPVASFFIQFCAR